MPHKGFLKRCFARVAGLRHAFMTFRHEQALQQAADDALYPSSPARELTAGENTLVKSIFGRKLRTDKIRKYYSAAEKMAARPGYVVAATTFNKAVKFYGPRYSEADYSQTQNSYNFGTFVHEIAHVWQNQHPLLQALHDILHSTRSYEYELQEHSHFRDFGQEQQASIVEDYARQFLFLGREVSLARTETYIPSAAPQPYNEHSMRSLYLLQKVVEDKFPEARKTRLRLQAQRHFLPKPPSPPLQTPWPPQPPALAL